MLELELLRALYLRHIICLPGGNKQKRHKLLISRYSILYLPVLEYDKGGGGCNRREAGMQGWLTNLLSVCHFSIWRESQSDKQPMTYSVKPEVVHYKSTY